MPTIFHFSLRLVSRIVLQSKKHEMHWPDKPRKETKMAVFLLFEKLFELDADRMTLKLVELISAFIPASTITNVV